jgi:acetyl esterase/lipase
VAIVGFSAGGHLSASVCTLFDTVKEDDPTLAPFTNRPDAAVLSYPVITAGQYAHQGSADALHALLGREHAVLVGVDADSDHYAVEQRQHTTQDGLVTADEGVE